MLRTYNKSIKILAYLKLPLLALAFIVFLVPQVGEAKSVTWTTNSIPILDYCWTNGGNLTSCPNDPGIGAYVQGLRPSSASVTFSATLKNTNTNAVINDGDSVPVGTQITVMPTPHVSNDISWFGTGFSSDSPNGEWGGKYWDFLTGTEYAPSLTCNAKDYVGIYDAGTTFQGQEMTYVIYAPFAFVNPASQVITTSSNLSCGAPQADDSEVCQVTAAGAAFATVKYADSSNTNITSYGRFFYRYKPTFGANFGVCIANNIPMAQPNGQINAAGAALTDPYSVLIPPQTITFNLTATAAAINGTCNNAVNNSCSAGTLSDTADSGTQYLWQCVGSGGGGTDSCALNKPINGSCSGSANTCNTGTVSNQTQNATTYFWSCNGQYGGTTNNSCSAAIPASPVNGSCGSSVNTCTQGTLSDIGDTSTQYQWICNGQNGGSPSGTCTAPIPVVNGSCNNTVNNGCSSGTLNNTADTATLYQWQCVGSGGGASPSCSMPIPVVNSAPNTPTITGAASGVTNTAYPYTISATDPNSDPVRYGITDSACTVVTQWLPGAGTVPSGTSQTYTKTWLSANAYTIYVLAEDSQGARSACASKTVTISAAPVTTATLTINGSAGPISVPKNTSVNLAWSSANAPSCTKWGGSWGSGETIGVSGADTTVVTATADYMVSCGGVQSVVHVDVVNQTPNPPTITYVSGTKQTNQAITFNVQGSDPDNDNVFYEIDWDNNGTVDATTMTVPSNTAQPATHSWTSAGTQTFQARTVDLSGARSAWTQHSETITASPPTATLKYSINGGAYTVGDVTVDPGDSISLQWSSTDTTSCSATQGSGFAASGTTGTDPVNTPAPNTSDSFKVTCTGPGGSATAMVNVTTRQKPNLNQPNMTISNLGSFDAVTAKYSSVDVYFSTANDGGSVTKSAAQYLVEPTGYAALSGSIPSGLNPGPAGFNKTVTVPGPIGFGNFTVKVSVDTPIASGGSVSETNESDNINTATLTIPPPDPGLSLTVDKQRVRSGETTTIRYTIANPYTGISCVTYGPNLPATAAALPSGSRNTAAITSASLYTLECTEATTNTKFKKTTTVELEGKIEEI